jgi:hypothetical protein
MGDILDRQLVHTYIDKLPPEQLAAVRSLLEGLLESEIPDLKILGDIGLTLEEFERMSLN